MVGHPPWCEHLHLVDGLLSACEACGYDSVDLEVGGWDFTLSNPDGIVPLRIATDCQFST